MIKKLFFLLFMMFFSFSSITFAQEEKEWIMYFTSEQKAYEFQHKYPNYSIDRVDNIVKVSATRNQVEQWKSSKTIENFDPNYVKTSVNRPLVNDPLVTRQWGLEAIKFQSVIEKYSTTSKNLLIGKSFSTENEHFPYSSQPFESNTFKISLDGEMINRLSILLDHQEGNWTLSVLDENKNLISKNSGTSEKLDVLLPRGKQLDTLIINIHLQKQWKTTPKIQKVTGVHHIRIGVIDSGIAPHQDFCDNILTSLGKDYKDGFSTPTDEYGHGTHVTGIMGACSNNQTGISGTLAGAPVDIIPLKVLNKYGLGGDYEISKAIQDAIEMNVDVLNISIAGKGKTMMLEESVKKAFEHQIPVIVAAGNWSTLTNTIYPAAFPYVITVSGLTPKKTKVPTSNYGWEVDISAPGENIVSTFLHNTYEPLTGTSMATPFVSTAASLLKVEHPTMDIVQLRTQLMKSTDDVMEKGYDINSGNGSINYQSILDKNQFAPSKMEWLELKEGQTLTKANQLIAFSPTTKGMTAHIFLNENKINEQKINQLLNTVQVPINLQHPNNRFITILTDGEKVEEINYLQAKQSNPSKDEFRDVPHSYWAYQEINEAYQEGLINGYDSKFFRPDDPVTRKHTTMMLNRLFKWNQLETLKPPFSDVSGELNIANFSILSAAEQGVIRGYPTGEFLPNQHLTRGQMALMLARSLHLRQTSEIAKPHLFKDVKETDEIYHAVQVLTSMGIITKQEYFKPNHRLTRAQLASFLVRTMHKRLL
ncbi:hypothetical protein J2S13_001700 [Oikeobacillus pervagus]|uniref:SLH domain-containing protein n=1 Tax=Oikeobacillus pervagus TaxID=1325931 RepID=A0AAJ1T5X4_9BACI|nr:S8 family serine peptidase [Oikeobacillus pervagus]MDQ0215300.1 hypothetical protein [Oikeobacillus pervagus]